jgi:UDP-N-acetylglucosamine transferase subunit ALG13
MIFLTIGTYPLPFNRLVKAIDDMVGEGLIQDEIFAQIGFCDYVPQHMKSVKLLKKEDYDATFADADALISHAGMGSISMALNSRKPLLAMPRLKKYNEVVNDHQLGIARKFSELGHILVAYDTADLPDCIRRLKGFVPTERKANPDAVAGRIRDFLDNLQK